MRLPLPPLDYNYTSSFFLAGTASPKRKRNLNIRVVHWAMQIYFHSNIFKDPQNDSKCPSSFTFHSASKPGCEKKGYPPIVALVLPALSPKTAPDNFGLYTGAPEGMSCSLALSGVRFKSGYYVSQRRAEASREVSSCVASDRLQRTIKNAIHVLLDTQ